MKTAVISLLFIISLNLPYGEANAQNVWYVDRDAPTTTRDGRSWETAWTTTDSVWGSGHGVNWNIVQAGDTVYISGGTDSTRYERYFGAAPSIRGVQFDPNAPDFDPQVVVTRAWHEFHNGEVWFYNEDSTQLYAFICRDISGIKFVDINFRTNVSPAYNENNSMTILVEDNERITFENCTFTNAGTGGALVLGGSFHIVENCLIQNLTNSSTTDQDVFTLGGSRGGHKIINNVIIQRNIVDSTDAHPDMMQFSGQYGESTEYHETLFLNNFIWQITPNRLGDYNAGLYMSSGNTISKQRFVFINNILVLTLSDSAHDGTPRAVPAIWLRGANTPTAEFSLRVFNNTIIYPSASMLLSRVDTVIAKNNFFIQTHPLTDAGIMVYNSEALQLLDMDYNYWYSHDWTKVYQWRTNVYRTFDQFKALAGTGVYLNTDNNSDTSYINPFPQPDSSIISYMTPEAQRGAGVNLSHLANQYPEIMFDILGNPRPLTGPWDIGALQYQGGQSSIINVQGKIFLQGPLDGNLMKTALADSCSCIPLQQPYSAAPWNYSGSESLILPGGQPGSGYVDWVLVELRSSSNPIQVQGRRAAILRNDGMLLEPDGSLGVKFVNMQEGLYYITVFHRNHLAVMSALPVYLNSNSQLYDFTNAMNKAFGNNPMADFGGAGFGMYSGDGNGDGGINIFDKNVVWQSQNGTMGYLGGDFNLNGGVDATDVNWHWNINNGTMTQVP